MQIEQEDNNFILEKHIIYFNTHEVPAGFYDVGVFNNILAEKFVSINPIFREITKKKICLTI